MMTHDGRALQIAIRPDDVVVEDTLWMEAHILMQDHSNVGPHDVAEADILWMVAHILMQGYSNVAQNDVVEEDIPWWVDGSLSVVNVFLSV